MRRLGSGWWASLRGLRNASSSLTHSGKIPLWVAARLPDSLPRESVFRAPPSVGGRATRSSQVPVRRLAKPRCPRTVADVWSVLRFKHHLGERFKKPSVCPVGAVRLRSGQVLDHFLKIVNRYSLGKLHPVTQGHAADRGHWNSYLLAFGHSEKVG